MNTEVSVDKAATKLWQSYTSSNIIIYYLVVMYDYSFARV